MREYKAGIILTAINAIPNVMGERLANEAAKGIREGHWSYGYMAGFGLNAMTSSFAIYLGDRLDLSEKSKLLLASITPTISTLHEFFPVIKRYSTFEKTDIAIYWAAAILGYLSTKGLAHVGQLHFSRARSQESIDEIVEHEEIVN